MRSNKFLFRKVHILSRAFFLEKAIHDKKNIVEVLDYLLAEEAKTKKNRAVENQIKMSGGVGKTHLAVSLGMIAAQHRYSTYYINCHNLITQLNKAHYENRLQERLKNYAKNKVLIIDEIGYLPMDIQGQIYFFN